MFGCESVEIARHARDIARHGATATYTARRTRRGGGAHEHSSQASSRTGRASTADWPTRPDGPAGRSIARATSPLDIGDVTSMGGACVSSAFTRRITGRGRSSEAFDFSAM